MYNIGITARITKDELWITFIEHDLSMFIPNSCTGCPQGYPQQGDAAVSDPRLRLTDAVRQQSLAPRCALLR